MTKTTAGEPPYALRRRIVALCPAAAAIAYPFLLQAFHVVVSPPNLLSAIRLTVASLVLILAFAMPLSGLAFAYWLTARRNHRNWTYARAAWLMPASQRRHFLFSSVSRPGWWDYTYQKSYSGSGCGR